MMSAAASAQPEVQVDLPRPRFAGATRWLRNPRIRFGGTVCALIVIMALFGEQLAPRGPEQVDFGHVLESPTVDRPLGTDHVGRDVFSRAIVGSRIAAQVALVSVSVAVVLGVTIGIISGYVGGWTDRLLMTVVDAFLAFPSLILILALTAVLGVSLTNAMIAIGIAAFPAFARISRGSVLTVRNHDYVIAARVVGASPVRILLRQILPNIVAPIIVLASLQVSTAILAEAGLSYLGLGAQPPTSSWGFSINQGRQYFVEAPWTVFGPGAFLFVTVLALNILGDGIRDLTDPRLRAR